MSRTLEELSRDKFLAEAESLAALMAHPAWPVFEGLIASMRLDALEHMARAKDAREIAVYQGAVAAFLEIMERPGQVVQTGRAVMDEEAGPKRAARQMLDGVAPLEDDL